MSSAESRGLPSSSFPLTKSSKAARLQRKVKPMTKISSKKGRSKASAAGWKSIDFSPYADTLDCAVLDFEEISDREGEIFDAFLGGRGRGDDAGSGAATATLPLSLSATVTASASDSGSESGEDGPEWTGFGTDIASVTNTQQQQQQQQQHHHQQQHTCPPLWHSLIPSLHPLLFPLLSTYPTPTAIQSAAIPISVSRSPCRDVIAVSETGSGKTLAYLIPILQYIHSRPPEESQTSSALILCPTRELALQVHAALKAAAPGVHSAAVIGGMSEQKQVRLLAKRPSVVIATPGRLWDLIAADSAVRDSLKRIRFLVIDEADRMVQAGHFKELDQIVALFNRVASQPEPQEGEDVNAAEWKGYARMPDLVQDQVRSRDDMQTFIYSATLSKDLQQNLKNKKPFKKPAAGRDGSKPAGAAVADPEAVVDPATGAAVSSASVVNGKKRKRSEGTSTIDDLLERIDFRDSDPAFVDLSTQSGVAATLQECQIECLNEEKDAYVYFFLLRYLGKSIIFVSSIDAIRRITPMLELLKINAIPLHSQLQQRQRLRNLDKFKASKNAVLVATDVASRGLDVPAVDHVIHYQLPTTTDAYIHRSGRTARSGTEGMALLLVGPDEKKLARSLQTQLKRTTQLKELAVDRGMISKLKLRVDLARKIDMASHKVKKAKHEDSWLKKTADELEIELSSDEDDKFAAEDGGKSSAVIRSTAKSAQLKSQLAALLSQPLLAQGISAKYLTSGAAGVSLIDNMMNSQHHSQLLGSSTTTAVGDAKTLAKVRRVKSKPVAR